jgi:dolichyl-phosphate beta-glucosyltransferase
MKRVGLMSKDILIIVPCFNETGRLRRENFMPLLEQPDLVLLFVDDGSTDGTGDFIAHEFAGFPDSAQLYRLGSNRGKAEAVRAGFNQALAGEYRYIGYTDADMSVPAEEMIRLAQIIRAEKLKMVFGSRVAVLGAEIERKPLRHYAGRIFATAASLGLDLVVYDTQCGAKVLERCPALADAARFPFVNRWAFDVELIGRLLTPVTPGVEPVGVRQMKEIPIAVWRDVPGSKLGVFSMLLAGMELLSISLDLRKRRRRQAVSLAAG